MATRRTTGRFVERTLRDDAGREHRYSVWIPASIGRDELRPVILSLHGSGECGTDGRRPTKVGLGPVLADGAPCDAIVVFPQAGKDDLWFDEAGTRAMRALDDSIAEFGGDPRRVSLTGLSLGGNGVWHLALAHPGRFTALAPVCGWLEVGVLPEELRLAHDPYRAVAERLREVPTWIFHGARDDVVPVEASRRMATALESVGAPVRYTEYADVAHDSWKPAYRDPALLAWLCAPDGEPRSPFAG